MAHLHLHKSKKILMLVLALIVVISSVIASVAVFTDRVNRTTTIQVSTFDDDGYAIKRTAPDGYFTAGETVEVTLQECNKKSEDITSQITMTVLWTSPVPNVYPWGNTAAGNAVITFDGETVPYTVNSDKTITFTLPEKVLTADTSDITSSLKFQIPSALASTGKLSFNFDLIELGYASWTTGYNNNNLESLDFNVNVAWNISKKQTTAAGNPNRDVVAVLTEGSTPGQYGLKIIKNGSADNTNNGQMMDWSAKDQTPWAPYTITDLTIDEGVTSVGDYAFAGETGVTALDFPSTMTDIGTSAFDGIGLSGELVIPASIETIESLAFGNLPNVTAITFEHTSDDNLSLPNNTAAGKETSGAFYVPNYVKTIFDFNGNSDAEKYNWVNDNRMKKGITDAQLTYDDVVVGQTVDPELVILPDDHDDYQSIHYEVIEGEEFATVDPDTGVVTGTAQGTSTIQVTIVDANGDEITAQGTVNILGIGITDATLSYDDVVVGQSVDPDLTILPENHGPYQSIKYEVISGDNYASVDPDTGVVTGLAQGTSTIQVTIVDANGKTVTAQGTVNILGIGVTRATLTYDDVVIGQTVDPDLDLLPANHGPVQSTLYEITEGETFAEVVDPTTGVVKGLAQGTATVKVTITDANGNTVSTTATVKVLGIGVTDATLSYDDVRVGETVDPDLNILPANHGPVQSVTYSITAGKTFAEMVDPTTGVVRGLAKGTATVEVTIVDTNGDTTTRQGTVTVYDPVPILAEKQTWFTQGGTTVDPSAITSIDIVDTYNTSGKTIVSTWDASAGMIGTVTAYVESDGSGSTYKLTLAGNGYGKIFTNADSTNAFRDFTELLQVNGTNILDTSNTTTMQAMFNWCSQLTTLDTSNWNTSKVTDMSSMFYSCHNLTAVDVATKEITANGITYTAWDTSKVEDMSSMFSYCYDLNSVDVSGWDTGKVGYMQYLFNFCQKLTTVDVSDWDVSNVTDTSAMFQHCKALKTLDVSQWAFTTKLKDTSSMFSGCAVLQALKVDNWIMDSVTDTSAMFSGCETLTTLGVDNWNVGNVIDMDYMFLECASMTSLNVSKWNVSRVTGMEKMFAYCESLPTLAVDNWNVSSVKDMRAMFIDCSSLTSLNVSNWQTTSLSLVTHYSGEYHSDDNTRYYWDQGMFEGCSSLPVIDISGWDMDQITNDARMFYGCTSLKSLTIPASLSIISPEFAYNCTSLTEITFNHASGSRPSLPTEGTKTADMYPTADENGVYSDGGAFYVPTYVETYIRGENNIMSPAVYDWLTENRMKIPELAAQQTWLTQGSPTDSSSGQTIYRSMIDSLELVNYYDTRGKTILDQWDASIYSTGSDDNWGPVTAYLENGEDGGYKLTLAGNGYGCVYANANSNSAFSNFRETPSIDLGDVLNAKNVQDASYMFWGCSAATKITIGDWSKSSKLSTMKEMFCQCAVLEELNVSNIDTSNVEIMSNVFSGCYDLATITGLDTWDTGNVTNMGSMFSNCNALNDASFQGVYNWDVSKVENFLWMFNYCESITEADMSNWQITSATDIGRMFEHCMKLETLNVSSWDTTNLTADGVDMLAYQCPSLTTIILGEKFIVSEDQIPYNETNQANNMFFVTYDADYNDYVYSEDNPLITEVIGANVLMANTYDWVSDHRALLKDKPILASGGSWFRATNENVTKPSITSVTFADTYTPTGTVADSWDASAERNNSVIAYAEDDGLGNGTYKLTIAGNGYGCIFANESSGYSFGGISKSDQFSSLVSFNDPNQILNTSMATSMSRMFGGASALQTADVGHWNTSNVESMHMLFYYCESLETVDVSDWDMRKVENLHWAFSHCESLTTLDTSDWETPVLNDLYGTFESCRKLITLDVSGWDVSNVTTLEYTFQYCNSLTTLDVSKWDTSSVDCMDYCFSYCYSFTTIPVGNWNTSNVTSMVSMFNYCRALTSLDVATKVVNAAGTDQQYTAWDVSSVKSLWHTFEGCSNLPYLDVSAWQTNSLVNTSKTFYGCEKLATLDVSGWNMSSVGYAYSMFTDCKSLAVIDVSEWDTSSLKEIENYVYSTGNADLGMFENCTSLKVIDLSSWDMSQITNTAHMFYNCTSLESIIIPASAAHISAEFAYNCPKLTSITFLHGANDTLNMPTAGKKTADLYDSDSADEYGVYSDGGAFYVSSSLNTTVNSNGNAAIANYNWAGDNRTGVSLAMVLMTSKNPNSTDDVYNVNKDTEVDSSVTDDIYSVDKDTDVDSSITTGTNNVQNPSNNVYQVGKDTDIIAVQTFSVATSASKPAILSISDTSFASLLPSKAKIAAVSASSSMFNKAASV